MITESKIPVTSIVTRILSNKPINYDKFMVDGMDTSLWVPKFYLHSTRGNNDKSTIYHLRSNSGKTLFINSLYYTFYYFMDYLGYEPTETFEFIRINPCGIGDTNYSIYNRNLYYRLIIKKQYQVIDGYNRTYKILVARFYDNDPSMDFGFELRMTSRTVDLKLFPYVSLTGKNSEKILPEDFVYNLLLNINYPLYVYYYNKINNTLDRLNREYPKLVQQIGKFKPWRFDTNAPQKN